MNNPANRRHLAPSTGEPMFAKVSVLVVGSPALSRIVKHLFASGLDFEVVGSSRALRSFALTTPTHTCWCSGAGRSNRAHTTFADAASHPNSSGKSGHHLRTAE